MIDLHTLIQIAPFPDESRKDVIAKLDELSDSQKFQIVNLCWELISAQYQNDLRFELQKISIGDKLPTKEDIQKIQDDLFHQLLVKLQAADSDEKIEEVRAKLMEQAKTPADTPQGN